MRNNDSTEQAANRTRILLVDDHPMIRERLNELIQREPDLEVCGEAESRAQALEAVVLRRPDLVIVDLTLKDSHGLDLIKDLQRLNPKLPILVVSMQEESLYAERALRAGARGYITKQEASRKVMVAIRRVLAGDLYFSEQLAAQMATKALGRPRGGIQADELLADRELQVFELVGQGFGTRQIAQKLGLDIKTIETYRARIKEKLNLKDASELLQKAIAWTGRREQ